ncbi:TLDc domain-containing protein [Entamoeba marina]
MIVDANMLQMFFNALNDISDDNVRKVLFLLGDIIQSLTAKTFLQYLGIDNQKQLVTFLDSTPMKAATREEILKSYDTTEESLSKTRNGDIIKSGSPINLNSIVTTPKTFKANEGPGIITPPLSITPTRDRDSVKMELKNLRDNFEYFRNEVEGLKNLMKLMEQTVKLSKRDSFNKGKDIDGSKKNRRSSKSKTGADPDLNRMTEEMEFKLKRYEEKQIKMQQERVAKEVADYEFEQQQRRLMIFDDDEQLELIGSQLQTLQDWSGLKECSIIFDSNESDAARNNLKFNELIMNKPNLYFINIDKNHNIFGSFMKESITVMNEDIMDEDHFVFTLSRNGKNNIKRWFVKQGKEGGCKIFSQNDCLYQIGNANFGCFGISKLSLRRCVCCTLSEEYEGMSDLDVTGTNLKFFTTKRIIVLQMAE